MSGTPRVAQRDTCVRGSQSINWPALSPSAIVPSPRTATASGGTKGCRILNVASERLLPIVRLVVCPFAVAAATTVPLPLRATLV